MNIPLIGAVLAVAIWLWLMTAGLMIRKSWRIGYLEGQLAAWEERWREHQSLFHGPLSSGPTSMVSPLRSFNVASHADVFGGVAFGDDVIDPEWSTPLPAKCPVCDLELGDTPLQEHLRSPACWRAPLPDMPSRMLGWDGGYRNASGYMQPFPPEPK